MVVISTASENPAGLCPTCGGATRDGLCPGCMWRIALESADDAPAAPEPATPMILGDYELHEVIAQGGMAVVWRARQARLRRDVALKVLRESCLPGEELARRFRIEAEAISLLVHPHIVTVYEVGETNGRYFLSMELLAGSLADRLRRLPFAPKEAAALLAKIAVAVQHAHEHGVLHRDLKPSNILLDAQGEPHVSDFGLARVVEDQEHPTLSGALLGTPAYMAPEQARGAHGEVTTRSDVYSLGAILYEMLTGEIPFEHSSHLELLRRVTEESPRRPSLLRPGLDRDLETICLKCLEKGPAARYASARALAEDLGRWRRGEAIHARPASTFERVWKWSRRHKSQAALIAVAAGGTLAIAVLSVLFTTRLQHEVQSTHTAQRAVVRQLATHYGETASQFVRRDDPLRALPYIAQSCTLLADDPAASRRARMRFEAIVRTTPALVHLWLPGERLRSIDFDPIYQHVAIFAGKTATVYSADTGAAVTPPLTHAEEVLHGYLIERGRRLLCQTKGDTWALWDLPSGQRLAARKGFIFSMKSAPSLLDRQLAWRFLAWHKDTVQAYSVKDGEPEADPIHFRQPVAWAVQSRIDRDHPHPKGFSTYLIATEDGLLHLWDPETLQEKTAPIEIGRNSLLRGLDWTKDQYAFESDDARGLRLSLVDLASPRIVQETRTRTSTHRVHGWLGSPRRWCMLAREDNGFTLREVATDALLMFAHHEAQGYNSAIARDSGLLATTARDGTVRVWHDGGTPATPYLPVGGRAEQLVIDEVGEQLVTASTEPAVRFWRRRANDGAVFAGDEGSRLAGAFFAGPRLVLAGTGGDVQVRDLTPGASRAAGWHCGHPIRTLVCDASGTRALLVATGTVQLWDVNRQQRLSEAIPCPGGVRSAALSADGRHLALLTGTGVGRAGRPGQLVDIPIARAATAMFLSPDGQHLLVTAPDTTQLWSLASAAPALTGTFPTAQGSVFSADGTRFVLWGLAQPSGLLDAQVFATATGAAVLAPFRHGSDMTAAAFSPDGRTLLTACRSDARLWDLQTGALLRAAREHPLPPLACGFNPDGTLLWTRTAKELNIWDAATGASIVPPMPVQGRGSAVWSADGRWLASVDDKQGVRAWDLSPGTRSLPQIQALARLLSGHRLTTEGALYPLTAEELRAAQAESGAR